LDLLDGSKVLQGRELYKLLLELTADCKNLDVDLKQVLERLGMNPDQLNSETLRRVALSYLGELRQHLVDTPEENPWAEPWSGPQA
jgi:hypothetical protein